MAYLLLNVWRAGFSPADAAFDAPKLTARQASVLIAVNANRFTSIAT